MSEIKKARAKFLELTRAVNNSRGEEKQKLIKEKEIAMREYYKLKREEEKER